MIAIGGLEYQQPIRIGTLLQRLVVRDVRLQLDDIRDVELSDHFLKKFVGTGRAENNAQTCFADLPFAFETGKGPEKWQWITFLWVEQASVKESQRPFSSGKPGFRQTERNEITFVVAVRDEQAVFAGELRIAAEVHFSSGCRREDHA